MTTYGYLNLPKLPSDYPNREEAEAIQRLRDLFSGFHSSTDWTMHSGRDEDDADALPSPPETVFVLARPERGAARQYPGFHIVSFLAFDYRARKYVSIDRDVETVMQRVWPLAWRKGGVYEFDGAYWDPNYQDIALFIRWGLTTALFGPNSGPMLHCREM